MSILGLLDGEIASIVNDALADIFLSASYIQNGQTYSCLAIFQQWSRYYGSGGAVTASDCSILVIANSLAVQPVAGDIITLQGETYVVFSGSDTKGAVSRDPARATWTLLCKLLPSNGSVQTAVYASLAAIAAALGQPFNLYRPTGPSNPTQTKLLTLPAQFVANQSTTKSQFSIPNAYGKPLWQTYVDGTQTKVGDYLIGGAGIFFIASMAPLMPILSVQCNRVLSFLNAGFVPTDGTADAGYAGDTAAKDTVSGAQKLTGWPASVLLGSKSETTPDKLPSDPRAGGWQILLPAIPGVILSFGDEATDDQGASYTISAAELTDLGWRLNCTENHV